MTPETCPNCGADVPRNAKACPACGADDATGWSEHAYASSLNLPEESFDYDDFLEREFGHKNAIPRGMKWYWWLAAIVVAALFIVGLVKWFR
jgi:predicted amidophosphoribosyltransferase